MDLRGFVDAFARLSMMAFPSPSLHLPSHDAKPSSSTTTTTETVKQDDPQSDTSNSPTKHVAMPAVQQGIAHLARFYECKYGRRMEDEKMEPRRASSKVPQILSCTPSVVPCSGGTSVTVQGRNFDTGRSVDCTFRIGTLQFVEGEVHSESEAVFVAPAHPPDEILISLTHINASSSCPASLGPQPVLEIKFKAQTVVAASNDNERYGDSFEFVYSDTPPPYAVPANVLHHLSRVFPLYCSTHAAYTVDAMVDAAWLQFLDAYELLKDQDEKRKEAFDDYAFAKTVGSGRRRETRLVMAFPQFLCALAKAMIQTYTGELQDAMEYVFGNVDAVKSPTKQKKAVPLFKTIPPLEAEHPVLSDMLGMLEPSHLPRHFSLYAGPVYVASLLAKPGLVCGLARSPVVDCVSHVPHARDALVAACLESETFDSAVARLRLSGFDLCCAQPSHAVSVCRCWWLIQARTSTHVATLWDHAGQLSTLRWLPSTGVAEHPSMTLTVYADDASVGHIVQLYLKRTPLLAYREQLEKLGVFFKTKL
jgi:hypothetical protein